LREANLDHHLENNTQPRTSPRRQGSARQTVRARRRYPRKPKPAKRRTAKDEDDETAELPSRELASKKDYQLTQALNLLKGMQIIRSKPC
jgi:carboxyl-terminal processing protease